MKTGSRCFSNSPFSPIFGSSQKINGLKKLIILSTLLIATIFMLAFNLLPHHHHGEVACLVTEDMHDPSEATDTNCSYDNATKSFVVNKEVKQLASYRFINHFLPLFAIVANELLLKQVDRPAYALFEAPANHYRSVLLCADNGLRAPPVA